MQASSLYHQNLVSGQFIFNRKSASPLQTIPQLPDVPRPIVFLKTTARFVI
jgi:hypothetical protein